MKTWFIFPVLLSVCTYVQISRAQCEIGKGKFNVPFPDIEEKAVLSYQMSVEYTAPDAKQTDFFTEYYDVLSGRGRVESHQSGQSLTYIYRTRTAEAWEITQRKCTWRNLTEIPEFLKDDQNNWIFEVKDNPLKRTVGPSAMFKRALDVSKNVVGKIAYMGNNVYVRGLKAQYWRWCDSKQETDSYVDFYFTDTDVENPLGIKDLRTIPLRVVYGGTRPGVTKELSNQQYEIMSFQPFISLDIKPFQLPKYLRCQRGQTAIDEAPSLPDFSNKNLMFRAEVIYRIIDWETRNDVKVWTYYSTLLMALDVSTNHLAYYYTPWNSTKPKDDKQEPIVDSPEYIIYDMKHGYAYKTNIASGQCIISRQSSFVPKYKLPNNGGSISLTDPSVLFPNDELEYVTEGTDRGLEVNIFEGVFKDYVLDKDDSAVTVPEVFVSHSYLKDDVIEDNTVTVQNALTQVQLRMKGRFDKDQAIELVTFNFYGFSTQLRNRRSLFDVRRCYKNDDDYLLLTIGFNADQKVLQQIKNDIPTIQANVIDSIILGSELNPVRMPIVLVDFKEALYVTVMILGKPPLELDYMQPEENKVITNTKELQGVSSFDACAQACLETEDNCWGFSLCGENNQGLCAFGVNDNSKIAEKKGCSLYRRYNNKTFIPSKENAIENIRRAVEARQLKLVVVAGDNMVQLEASSVLVTNPSQDDDLFDKMGNVLDPRLIVVKAGAKLKSGTAVVNLGKLRYDQCQSVCLDYKDCETLSYCLKGSECIVSKTDFADLKPQDMDDNNLCNVLARKYADHFGRSPGVKLSVMAKSVLNKATVEECAKACMKETSFKCLSFDHCPTLKEGACRLHTVYYPNPNTKEAKTERSTSCGHYYRKYSTVFNKFPKKRSVGSKIPPLMNLTLEECSNACMDYGSGTCFGFDFCQDDIVSATSCILIDKDPTLLKKVSSPVCTNFMRGEAEYAPRPYSNSYAGGIGFLCLLVGALLGAAIVFTIAYVRVNRR